jgi:hypothetical protein
MTGRIVVAWLWRNTLNTGVEASSLGAISTAATLRIALRLSNTDSLGHDHGVA